MNRSKLCAICVVLLGLHSINAYCNPITSDDDIIHVETIVLVGDILTNELVKTEYDSVSFNGRMVPTMKYDFYQIEISVRFLLQGDSIVDTITALHKTVHIDKPYYTHYKHILCMLVRRTDGESWFLPMSSCWYDIYETESHCWYVSAFSGGKYHEDALQKYGLEISLPKSEYIDSSFLERTYDNITMLRTINHENEHIPPIGYFYSIKGNRAIPKIGVGLNDFLQYIHPITSIPSEFIATE